MRLKKTLSILLASVMVCTLLCIPAAAAPLSYEAGTAYMYIHFPDVIKQETVRASLAGSGEPKECDMFTLSSDITNLTSTPVSYGVYPPDVTNWWELYPAQKTAEGTFSYTTEGKIQTGVREIHLDAAAEAGEYWYLSFQHATGPTTLVELAGLMLHLERAGQQAQQPSGWAQGLINEAAEKGLVTERTEGLYKDSITRLQFAELAVNLIEKATGKEITPAENTFQDTSDVMALKAVAAGVASGKGEGQFAPDAQITRQEMCVMLSKVIAYVDAANGSSTLENTSAELDAAKFNDAGDVASWAAPAVALLTNNGLMSGSNGGIAPKSNTTVEQAIILVLAHFNKF